MSGQGQRRWRMAFVVVGLGWIATPAHAQVGLSATPGADTATASPAAMMANPYLNPYLNPYMNPTATQRPMSGRDAALYLYMANSANGGLGSGQVSGTRPIPGAVNVGVAGQRAVAPARPQAAGGAASKRLKGKLPAAEMPNSASEPGSGAAKFFNPGPGNSNGAGRYYARRNTYFNSNGR